MYDDEYDDGWWQAQELLEHEQYEEAQLGAQKESDDNGKQK